jgi:hypothetical protein
VKASVVAATTAAGTLASSFANGSVVDGVTLATGNRILIKNQTSGSDNGIYTVNASGAPTRSTDCNSATTYITGSFVFVELGSINQGASFIVNTQGTITPGTTSVAWVQFSGASSNASNLAGGATGSLPYQSAASTTAMLAGNSAATDQVLVSHGTGSAALAPTLSNAPALSAANMNNFPTFNQNTTGTAAGLSGSQTANTVYAAPSGSAGTASFRALTALDVPILNQNTTGSAASLSTTLAIASGGTGATTAAGARTNLGTVGKFAVTFGDGVATTYVITHNLGTLDVIPEVYFVATPFQVANCEMQLTSINTTTLLFAVAPASSSLRCVVIG